MGLTRIRAEQISDIDYKQAVRVIQRTNITLSGGAPSSVDSVNLSANDRILVSGQDAAAENGIYRVQTLGQGSNGTWVRTSDANADGEIEAGMIIMVTEGDVYKDTQWKLTTNNPIIIGTTPLTFVLNAVSVIGGENTQVQYNQSGVLAGSANLIFDGSSLTVGGNVSATYFVGNGSALTGISTDLTNVASDIVPAANLTYSLGNASNQWANIYVGGNTIFLGGLQLKDSGSNTFAVYAADGTTPASITATVTAGDITGTVANATYAVTASVADLANAVTGANVTGTVANATNADTVTNATQANITSVGTLTSLAVTGNVTTGNVSGTTGTFTNVAGTVTTAAQPNITSVGTLTSLTVNGLSTHVGNVDITGNINVTGNLNYENVTDLVIGDPLIYIGENNTGNLFDLGMIVSWNDGTYQHGGWVRDASDGMWKLFGNVISEPTTTVDFTNAIYQPMQAGAITATTGTFSGNISSNYFIGNGSLLTGITSSGGGISFTSQANTAPTSPNNGDFWYDTFADVKYQYIDDGTSSQWIDQSFPTSFSSISVGNITNSNANGVGNIGSSVGYFNNIFAKATSAQYADLAEFYDSDQDYPAGTVVVFGGDQEITVTGRSHDTAVAGVISTDPAFIMNTAQKGKCMLPVALTGRVPCRVQGPVAKGDVLVTGVQPGTAQRIQDQWQPGCVVGKSIEEIKDNEVKMIQIVVGRF